MSASDVDYLISTKLNRFVGYQSKKGNLGYVKCFISGIWDITNHWKKILGEGEHFDWFVKFLSLVMTHERYCLERAFQRIRIKGGMCTPCCVQKIAEITFEYLFDVEFEDVD